MPVGETFLKFTDYPFAYSLVIIAAKAAGFSISQNQFLIFGLAGALGTFLTIVDFPGWIVRRRITKDINRRKEKNELYDEKKYAIGAINTRSIVFEIDKLVGLVYFILTATVFLIGVLVSPYLAESLVIYDADNRIVCDSRCIEVTIAVGSVILFAILSMIVDKRWKEMSDKLLIAGFHKFVINNEFALENSVQNMTRAVEQNDWNIAKEWQEKIKLEIKHKKNKREFIIKSAEKIYRPLHEESSQITDLIRQTVSGKYYPTFPIAVWQDIMLRSNYFLIEETIFHKIRTFYEKIIEYNKLKETFNRKTESIILQHASQTFNKKIRELRYNVQYITNNEPHIVQVNLLSCALFNIHPLQFFKEENIIPHQLDMEVRDPTNNSSRNQPTNSQSDFVLFDQMWERILRDVNNDPEYTEIKKIFDFINYENSNLISIYEDKIRMELNV